MSSIQTERLKTLYQVIAGLPAAAINLGIWRQGPGSAYPTDEQLIAGAAKKPGQGLVASPINWASTYPPFFEQGLGVATIKRAKPNDPRVRKASAKFFGLTAAEASELFGDLDIESFSYFDHKNAFLKRLRDIMVRRQIITSERSLSLAHEEAGRNRLEA